MVMKRLPVLLSFGCFLLLCASVAVWGMRMFKGQARGVSSSVVQQSFEPATGMWGGIFGESQSVQNAPSSYLLKGLFCHELVCQALPWLLQMENLPSLCGLARISSGVQVREISARSVQFAEGGVLRRIELPQGNVTAANGIVAPVAENSVQVSQTILYETFPVQFHHPVSPKCSNGRAGSTRCFHASCNGSKLIDRV
jgi:hypothetical protein